MHKVTIDSNLLVQNTVIHLYLLITVYTVTSLIHSILGFVPSSAKGKVPYWKVYNNLILGSKDAFVPIYLRVQNDDRNTYIQYELDYVL